MGRNDKLVILIFAIIVAIPIVLNEINEYNLRKIKEETLYISNHLNLAEPVEIPINKMIKLDNTNYKTRGIGKAIITNEGVMVVLSYKKYCSIKLPSIEEVVLSKSKCPNLYLIDGKIKELR